MKKIVFLIVIFLWLCLVFLSLVLSWRLRSPDKRVGFQTRAWSCGTGGVLPPPVADGVEGLQQKINLAKEGETISLPRGTYSGPTALPLGLGDSIFVSDSRGGAMYCMIRIEGKKITIKGQGQTATVFYGEGHARPYENPYQHRAGICVINSTVTFDRIRLKEFQKRGMVVYNSTVVIKNSLIEGHDEGGISLLGNSAGLFVNNFFHAMNFGAIMLWQNSQAKIINNIFNDAAIMFFYHPNLDDKAYAEIINNIFSADNREPIKQVDWWPQKAFKLKTNKLAYNLWQRTKCDSTLEYCDDFPGKIIGDPLYINPVADMCGIAPWSDFNLQTSSPAIGVGDPAIPGPKILGNAGGPCVEPDSSMCLNFIKENTPSPFIATSPVSLETVVDNNLPQEKKEDRLILPQKTEPLDKEDKQVQTPIRQKSIFIKQRVLFLQNNSLEKTIIIQILSLGQSIINLKETLEPQTAIEIDYSSYCRGFSHEIKAGIYFTSSSDQHKTLKYKHLVLDCYKSQVIDFE